MGKTTFAVKLRKDVPARTRRFCDEHGVRHSFSVEDAMEEKLRGENMKEDIRDLRRLNPEEKGAVSLDQCLKSPDAYQ